MSRPPVSNLHIQMGQEVLYLLLVTSMIANVLLVAVLLRSSVLVEEFAPGSTQAEKLVVVTQRLKKERDEGQAELAAAKSALSAAERERTELRKEVSGLRPASAPSAAKASLDQPPIIILRESEGYFFKPGSIDIDPEFRARLSTDIVPKLKMLSELYGAEVVEVIGHTDGNAMRERLRRGANLDETLGAFLDRRDSANVIAYDNVGLGMARAVSVARALRESGLPARLEVQPLSAAFLIAPNGRTAAAPRNVDDPSRRRIEIRIRRLTSTSGR